MNYQCDNCDFVDDEGNLPTAEDLFLRLTPGEVYTDKECPKCGALCYPAPDAKATSDGSQRTYSVRVVDTTYDIYEVQASSEEEAREIAEEIHCDGGPDTEFHQGGGCGERRVYVEVSHG